MLSIIAIRSSWRLQTGTKGASAFSATVLEAWGKVPLRMKCAVVGDCTASDILHTLGPGTLLSSVAGPVDPALDRREDLDPVLLVLDVALLVDVIKGGDLGVRPKLLVGLAEVVGEHLEVKRLGVLEARDRIKIDKETWCEFLAGVWWWILWSRWETRRR